MSCALTSTMASEHPMDTIRDRTFLESQWTSGKAEWRVW